MEDKDKTIDPRGLVGWLQDELLQLRTEIKKLQATVEERDKTITELRVELDRLRKAAKSVNKQLLENYNQNSDRGIAIRAVLKAWKHAGPLGTAQWEKFDHCIYLCEAAMEELK